MTQNFKQLSLAPEVQATLDSLGFVTPTEIQSKAIPLLLAQSKVDFHGQAQTGTGKTLAFGLPLLHRIDKTNRETQALVVAPTRELALQICESLRPFAQALNISIEAIYGGASMTEQMNQLRRGVHIVVGTPGRLNDHLSRKTLKLNNIKTLVLDEADIMLDMGFKDEIDEILEYTPKTREIWLFSATIKSGINDIMNEHMHNTQSVRIAKKVDAKASTLQYFCSVPMRSRLNALCRFIESAPDFYGFIFCQTKILTSEIAEQLIRRGYNVGALHGDINQSQRNAVIKKFKNKDITIVVATDVAARGIDIANLTHVVNYSLPEDHESYVHRIGRTGRAGKEGIAISFINKSETRSIQMLQRKFNFEIKPLDVPSRTTIIEARLTQASQYLTSLDATTPQKDNIDKKIATLITQLPENKLHSILSHIVYDKFLKSIVEEEELTITPALRDDAAYKTPGMQEISLAVGLEDGAKQEDIADCIKQTGILLEAQIHKIRLIKRRTFIEVPSEKAQDLINALRNESLVGRKLRPERVTEQQEDRRSMRRPSRGGFEGRGSFNNRRDNGYSSGRSGFRHY